MMVLSREAVRIMSGFSAEEAGLSSQQIALYCVEERWILREVAMAVTHLAITPCQYTD